MIFLILVSFGIIWLAKERTHSELILWDSPSEDLGSEVISNQPGVFDLSLRHEKHCVNFTFFDSIEVDYKGNLPPTKIYITSYRYPDQAQPQWKSELSINTNSSGVFKSPISAFKVLTPPEEGDQKGNQKVDPWWENTCELEVHTQLDSLPMGLNSIKLIRNSHMNYNVIIGLIALLWVMSILFLIVQKFKPNDPINSENAADSSHPNQSTESQISDQQISKGLPQEVSELNEEESQWYEEIEPVLLEEFLSKDFTLKSLAEEVNLTQRKVEEILNKKFNKNFESLHRGMILHEAFLKLQEGHIPKHVAQSLGFKSYGVFKRMFRQQYQVNPEQVQEKK